MKRADADTEFKLKTLRAARLFADAAAEDLAELARVARPLAVPRGKSFAKAGAEGEQVYVLQTGVAAELQAEAPEGEALLVALIGAGEVAGLVGALGRTARGPASPRPSRQVQSLCNVTALGLPAADVLRVCRRSTELALALAETLRDEAAETAALYVQSIAASLESRLSAYFARVADLVSTEDWNPATNIGPVSQSAVAQMLGVSREHVNRTLAMWERSGLIFQNKSGELVVQNRKRLAALAGDRARKASEKGDEWLWEIDAHLDHGLNQTAQHLALEAVKRAPRELKYAHRAVLAAARAGAYAEALALFFKLGLDKDKTNEDIACLRPRILRDLAFIGNPDAPDMTHLEESAKGYSEAFRKTQGTYSGVNAAGAHALLGDAARAKKVAHEVSALLAATDDDDADGYFHRATRAECRLLEGDAIGAASLFQAALDADDVTPGKRATSRRQLRRLAKPLDLKPEWIDRAVPQPQVLYFSGPIARKTDGDVASAIEEIVDALDDLLEREDVGWAHGALASGADIAIAERLIAADVSLSVHLPLPPQEFLRSSVHVGDESWRERFYDCMRSAATIDWARRSPGPCNAVWRLGGETAMGRAVRHADQLETRALGFFAAAANATEATSLSLGAAALWRARGLPLVEARCRWPGRDGAQRDLRAVEDEVLLFALALQPVENARAPLALAKAAAGADRVLDSAQTGVVASLFPTVETAFAAAREALAAKDAANVRLWLDVGVFTKAQLRPDATLDDPPLVAAACAPLTEPGVVFATDGFASAASLSPVLRAARFEYIGFAPTQEKLDPCALYQLQS